MSALVDTPADRCDHELALRAGTSQPRHTAAEEAALSAYLDAALDCVVIADESGCVVEFNKAAERTFGYTREEALGRTLAELIVPPSFASATVSPLPVSSRLAKSGCSGAGLS
jgi:PAS domain-containing protein